MRFLFHLGCWLRRQLSVGRREQGNSLDLEQSLWVALCLLFYSFKHEFEECFLYKQPLGQKVKSHMDFGLVKNDHIHWTFSALFKNWASLDGWLAGRVRILFDERAAEQSGLLRRHHTQTQHSNNTKLIHLLHSYSCPSEAMNQDRSVLSISQMHVCLLFGSWALMWLN